jgi:hypothetical protein
VDLQIEVSFDAEQTWRIYDIIDRVALKGATEQHNFHVKTPIRCHVRLSLRRRGGTVDSTAYVEAYLREHSGDRDETRPYITNYAEAFSDGAQAAETLLGTFAYGDWFALGDADTVELMVIKSTANDPTNVDLDVQTSDDSGTTGYEVTQIDSVAASIDSRSSTIKRITDFGTGNPERRSVVITELTPRSWVRVGARFVGGVAPDLLVWANCRRS